MPKSDINKLFRQSSVYFTSNFLVNAVSFLSFPIWTRAFSTSEYGTMSLATVTLAFLLVFSKLGIQHAVLRFYAEFKNNNRDLDISYFYTTAIVSSVILSLIISVGYYFIIEAFLKKQTEITLLKILYLLPLLMIFGTINAIFLMFFRSEQKVKLHGIVNVTSRYLRFGSSVLFAIVFKFGLFGFFIGWAIAEILYSAILIFYFLVDNKIKLSHTSVALFKEFTFYGLPLLGTELTTILLASGDRYVIQMMMDTAAVGIYSASYNVIDYSVSFFYLPLRLALMPLYMKMWEEQGRSATEQFLSKVQTYYFMLGIPIIFGMTAIGKDLIILLASSQYQQGAVIIPYVITGVLLHHAHFIYCAGFYLQKNTTSLLYVNVGGAMLNVVLNILLIPFWGIEGAAVATLIAYLLIAVVTMKLSFSYLKINIKFGEVLKFIFVSAGMYFLIQNINFGTPVFSLLIKIALAILFYFGTILIIDGNKRRKIISKIHLWFFPKGSVQKV